MIIILSSFVWAWTNFLLMLFCSVWTEVVGFFKLLLFCEALCSYCTERVSIDWLIIDSIISKRYSNIVTISEFRPVSVALTLNLSWLCCYCSLWRCGFFTRQPWTHHGDHLCCVSPWTADDRHGTWTQHDDNVNKRDSARWTSTNIQNEINEPKLLLLFPLRHKSLRWRLKS